MMRVTTGVDGLDEILRGGFIYPSVVLVAGTAGSGKTTFGIQSLFNGLRGTEERGLYVATTSELPGSVLKMMSSYSFFDPTLIENGQIVLTMPSSEELSDPHKFVEFLEAKVEEIRPSRIIIDSINPVLIGSRADRTFWFDFFARIRGWNALLLLVGEFTYDDLIKSELSYLSDGVIYLAQEPIYEKATRFVQVLKMRGIDYYGGRSPFSILDSGILVFPRTPAPLREAVPHERISTGIEGLDTMLKGGIYRGDTVVIAGPTGVGKTTMALHFLLAGVKTGEPGYMLSLEEEPAKIKRNARSFGWDLEEYEKKGLLKIEYISPMVYDPARHGKTLLKRAIDMQAKRIVIDGLSDYKIAIPDEMKRREHLRSLVENFASLGVTSLLTNETPRVIGIPTITEEGLSTIADVAIVLRYVEAESMIRRALVIVKGRGTDHDREIREFVITPQGISVRLPFKEYESVLTGEARRRVEEKVVRTLLERRRMGEF